MPAPAIVVCALLRPEVEAAIDGTELAAVPVRSFATACRGDAELPASTLEQAARQRLSLHAFGGRCVRGFAEKAEASEVSCSVHEEEQCAYLLARESLVDALEQDGAYVLTAGWLASWRAQLAAMGIDVPTAATMFAESASRLVLLDAGVWPRARANLAGMARELGLSEGAVPIALDHLRGKLRRGLAQVGIAAGRPLDPTAHEPAVAEYAMALDLLGELGALQRETEVLERVAEVCTLLFSPGRITFWRVEGGGHERVFEAPIGAPRAGDVPHVPAASTGFAQDGAVIVPIACLGERWGVLVAEEILFPSHIDEYLHIARFIAGVAGLSLANLRAAKRREGGGSSEPITTICCYCKDVRDDGNWTRIEAFVAPRLFLRFSHGICPTCFTKHFGEWGP